jgi:hypothetical protein
VFAGDGEGGAEARGEEDEREGDRALGRSAGLVLELGEVVRAEVAGLAALWDAVEGMGAPGV